MAVDARNSSARPTTSRCEKKQVRDRASGSHSRGFLLGGPPALGEAWLEAAAEAAVVMLRVCTRRGGAGNQIFCPAAGRGGLAGNRRSERITTGRGETRLSPAALAPAAAAAPAAAEGPLLVVRGTGSDGSSRRINDVARCSLSLRRAASSWTVGARGLRSSPATAFASSCRRSAAPCSSPARAIVRLQSPSTNTCRMAAPCNSMRSASPIRRSSRPAFQSYSAVRMMRFSSAKTCVSNGCINQVRRAGMITTCTPARRAAASTSAER